jgi:hypothetical protein
MALRVAHIPREGLRNRLLGLARVAGNICVFAKSKTRSRSPTRLAQSRWQWWVQSHLRSQYDKCQGARFKTASCDAEQESHRDTRTLFDTSPETTLRASWLPPVTNPCNHGASTLTPASSNSRSLSKRVCSSSRKLTPLTTSQTARLVSSRNIYEKGKSTFPLPSYPVQRPHWNGGAARRSDPTTPAW